MAPNYAEESGNAQILGEQSVFMLREKVYALIDGGGGGHLEF